MKEFSLDNMAEQYIDVLREIGNIGAGNAMTALSQLLQCKVDMKVPRVCLTEFADLGEMMGGEEEIMVGIYMPIDGDIRGSILFLSQKEAALHLVSKMMAVYGTPLSGELGAMELSAVQEVGNIITGAYLNSLSALTGMKIYPFPPEVVVDMAGAILSVPAIEFGAVSDRILLIQSQFYDEIKVDGYFVLIPGLESYPIILRSLGMMQE